MIGVLHLASTTTTHGKSPDILTIMPLCPTKVPFFFQYLFMSMGMHLVITILITKTKLKQIFNLGHWARMVAVWLFCAATWRITVHC